MQQTATLTKWGTSQGIRLSKEIVDLAKLKIGDEVSITADESQIIIKKTIKRVSLKDLFDGYTGDYKPEEIKWGTVGKEI